MILNQYLSILSSLMCLYACKVCMIGKRASNFMVGDVHEECTCNCKFLFCIFSTARNAEILKHVKEYMVHNSVVHGDNQVTEFNDGFLQEHVKSISISDSKLSPHEVSSEH